MQVGRVTSVPVKYWLTDQGAGGVTACVYSQVTVQTQNNLWPVSFFSVCTVKVILTHMWSSLKDTNHNMYFGQICSYFAFVPNCFTLLCTLCAMWE